MRANSSEDWQNNANSDSTYTYTKVQVLVLFIGNPCWCQTRCLAFASLAKSCPILLRPSGLWAVLQRLPARQSEPGNIQVARGLPKLHDNPSELAGSAGMPLVWPQ